uniref:Sec-independent protein translocase protein TatC n=1 Tax=candidate division WOR-3 bacterium TaxID=2052148 RepID=A0A7C4TDV5_UNCW3
MNERKLTFIDHLEELRRRLLSSLLFVALASILSFLFSRRILEFIINWTNIGTAYYFSPVEAFSVRIKLAIFLGVFISFPFILYQTWAFIGPGLTKREKRISLPFFFSGIILFLIGSCFAYFILIPFGLKFLLSFGTESLKPIMNINKILEFIFWCILGCGFLFQLPLIIFFLLRLGIIRVQTLTKHRAEFIVGILIISAIITPTGDMFTLLLISIPLILLIELSILFAKITSRN